VFDMAIQDNEMALRALSSVEASPEVRTMRAHCDECGAHAAVVAAGASVTGSCSVCGGASLQLMDEAVPPPRRML